MSLSSSSSWIIYVLYKICVVYVIEKLEVVFTYSINNYGDEIENHLTLLYLHRPLIWVKTE